MRVYVGVDWSARDIACSTVVEDEEPCWLGEFGRSHQQARALMERVRLRHPDASHIHVFIEAGAIGWVELLHHAGASVHLIDPKQAKSFAESMCSSGAKDDKRDSRMLAQMGRSRCSQLPAWKPASPLVVQLEQLSALHETRMKESTAEKQRLRAHLRERFPRLEAQLSDLGRSWVHHLLRHIPTAHDAAGLSRAEFDETMAGCGARKTTLEKVWSALEQTEAGSMAAEVAEVYAFSVRMMVDKIDRVGQELVLLEQKLDAISAEVGGRELLESVDGIGNKMAHRLLEFAFGDELPEHRDHASIKMGAAPVFKGSGKRRDGTPKGVVQMRRAASGRARGTVYLLGRLASQRLDWAKARFAYDKKRGKGAAHSYRIIARSLLRILTAMVKSGQPYDNAKYVAALKRQGLPWAMNL